MHCCLVFSVFNKLINSIWERRIWKKLIHDTLSEHKIRIRSLVLYKYLYFLFTIYHKSGQLIKSLFMLPKAVDSPAFRIESGGVGYSLPWYSMIRINSLKSEFLGATRMRQSQF